MNRKENARHAVEEYKKGAPRIKARPQVVYIETTNTCNLACPMCPITMGVAPFIGKSKLFQFDLMDKLRPFLEAAERCVMSGGGEPFLHPKFLDMIGVVKECGAQVVFNTNATLMDEKKSRGLVELQADTVSFSVDAATPEIYAAIRVGADLSVVAENVKRLVKIKKERKSDKPFLNLQMTLMRANLNEIVPVLEMAADWGIRHVVVEPLSPVFSGDAGYAAFVESNSVGADEVALPIRDAQKRAEKLGLIFSSHYLVMIGDAPQPDAKGFRCPQPWINFGVRADGRIFPCCGTTRVMGDLNSNSAPEIWNNDDYQALREAFALNRPPAYCDLCLKEGRAMFFSADLVGIKA